MIELVFLTFFTFIVGLFASLLINSAFPVLVDHQLLYRTTICDYIFSYLLLMIQIGIAIVIFQALMGIIFDLWCPDKIDLLKLAAPLSTLYAIQKAISLNNNKTD